MVLSTSIEGVEDVTLVNPPGQRSFNKKFSFSERGPVTITIRCTGGTAQDTCRYYYKLTAYITGAAPTGGTIPRIDWAAGGLGEALPCATEGSIFSVDGEGNKRTFLSVLADASADCGVDLKVGRADIVSLGPGESFHGRVTRRGDSVIYTIACSGDGGGHCRYAHGTYTEP